VKNKVLNLTYFSYEEKNKNSTSKHEVTTTNVRRFANDLKHHQILEDYVVRLLKYRIKSLELKR